jgi:hypothetical protein
MEITNASSVWMDMHYDLILDVGIVPFTVPLVSMRHMLIIHSKHSTTRIIKSMIRIMWIL